LSPKSFASLALFLFIFSPAAARGSGYAVEGIDRARVLPPAGAQVEPYRNAGYSLEVEEGEVRVTVDTSPLQSRAPYDPPWRRKAQGPIERVVRAVTAGAATEYDAASRILGWVARNLSYEHDRSQPQDPASVFARRSGYCTGISRLTVRMLETAGLGAREVAGYVGGGSRPGEPSGYHRWVEIEFSDLGWVFSDPLTHHHYVPASYVRLASEDLEPAQGLDGLLIERRDAVRTSDVSPAAAPGVRVRRNSHLRFAAALRVIDSDSKARLAVLEGVKIRLTRSFLGGETTFLGLEPGNYELRLLLPSRGWVARPVDIPGRLHKTVVLPTDPPMDRGRSMD